MKESLLMRIGIVLFMTIVCATSAALPQDRDDAKERRREAQQRLEKLRSEARDRPVQFAEPPVFRSGVRPGHDRNPRGQDSSDSLDIQGEMETPREGYRQVFDTVEEGIATGNVSAFAPHFDSQVSINLRGGESGYYSTNQAYYVLEGYFKPRKFGHFEFTTVGRSESNPYATGGARFTNKGSVEIAQVYVSLSWVGERWVISQFRIY